MAGIDFAPYKDALRHQAHRPLSVCRCPGLKEGADGDEAYYGNLDPYLLDANKIRESKALRRLLKTQVFSWPANPYIRTRWSHTMEVVSVSTAIAGILGLNVHLCEAIALGHDIGHPPYGHFGERMISDFGGRPFRHNVFGATVANVIERKGFGLRLSRDTVSGIIAHKRNGADIVSLGSAPLEFDVVAAADKIAYLTADINDSVRSGLLDPRHQAVSRLGGNQRARILNCVYALVSESSERGCISFVSSEIARVFKDIKSWMHDNVYRSLDGSESIQRQNYEIAHALILGSGLFSGHDPCLILALLSDLEVDCLAVRSKDGAAAFRNLSIMEILPDLQPGIDYADPYLRD